MIKKELNILMGIKLDLVALAVKNKAKGVFNKMLRLNPDDNQGARFLLAEIDAGRTFYESEV